MDVNSINPILQAFAEILPQIGFQEITKKGIALEGATLQNPGILINIGVMGPLKGAILIGMSIDDAQLFASKMMMGMQFAIWMNWRKALWRKWGTWFARMPAAYSVKRESSDWTFRRPRCWSARGRTSGCPFPKWS